MSIGPIWGIHSLSFILSCANITHFRLKGCALSLILRVRVFITRNWPIALLVLWLVAYYFQQSYFLHWVACGQGDTKLAIAYHFRINYDLNLETVEFLELGLCDFGETLLSARH